jgi:hypothetical protein
MACTYCGAGILPAGVRVSPSLLQYLRSVEDTRLFSGIAQISGPDHFVDVTNMIVTAQYNSRSQVALGNAITIEAGLRTGLVRTARPYRKTGVGSATSIATTFPSATWERAVDGRLLTGKWLRNTNTKEFLGNWEATNNLDSNSPEFEGIRLEAGDK